MKNKFLIVEDVEKKTSVDCIDIEIPIYGITLKILNKKNTETLDKIWKSKNTGYDMSTTDLENGIIIIRIYKYKDSSIVHELYHVVDFIMDHINHNKDKSSDEPSAYLMGYLYSEVMKIKKKLL